MILRKTLISCLMCMVLILLVLINSKIYAQSPLLIQGGGSPYFCGFEDPDENQYWVVKDAGSPNSWKVGTAEKNMGEHSMYVSYDNGVTAGNNNTKNFICTYRVFQLEAGVNFDISFDWKNPGYGKGELYVCWIDDSEIISPIEGFDDIPPTWLKTNMIKQGDSLLSGATSWQNKSFVVPGQGKPYKLLFFWKNSSASISASSKPSPAGCIDNVQIARSTDCPKPRNFKYTQLDASRAQFTWNGGAGPFQVMYKRTYDTEWTVLPETYEEEYRIMPLQKGSYTAAIRNICGNDTSIWAFYPNILIFYSNENCIDFLDLENSAKAYSGKFDYWSSFIKEGVQNHGYASVLSDHTVHFLEDEYDPRTNFKLKTIPPDGMPAVRLGNWNNGGKSATLEYTYTVHEDAPLLLIKYAMVLQDYGHDPDEQPSFRVEIMDENGDKQEEFDCGEANFMADRHAGGWELGEGYSDNVITYKDWTSAGLNLSNLIGQKVTVRFMARGCAHEAHSGYAYFTMDCMGARISGVGCGDKMFSTIDAPEGFRYRWFPKGQPEYMDQPGYKDTLQSFTPPEGTDDFGTYICRVITIGNEDCSFDLEANLDPRDVFANFEAKPNIKDCIAEYTFENNSYTLTRQYQEKGECESFYWDFGNGEISYDKSPTVEFEPGATYKVTLTAGVSDNLCVDKDSVYITIPAFKATNDTSYITTCTQNPDYEFDGIIYSSSGTYVSKPYKSIYGCDSIETLILKLADEYEETKEVTITNEEDYYFYGKKVEESGTYSHFVEGTGGDCDSTFILKLTVDTILRVDIYLPDICSDPEYPSFSINYQPRIGEIVEYSLIFGEKAKEAGFVDLIMEIHVDGKMEVDLPVNIRPDYYGAQLIFYGGQYRNDTIDLVIPVYYSAKILEQKWNDVIAVTNSNINGGYEFSEYSWYLEMVEIPGFEKSYIYLPPALEFGLQYRAKLTRVDDGVSIFTCPIEPERKSADSEISIYPTITARGSAIRVSMTAEQGEGSIWDVMGNHISDIKLQSETQFNAPDKKGIYLLKITTEDSESNLFRIIVN